MQKTRIRKKTDGYSMLKLGYARLPFLDFESYLRVVVGFDEDIQLIIQQYISSFVTYETSPGIYLTKVISEVVYSMGDHEGTLQFEYDDKTKKTKFILTSFEGTFGTVRFVEKFFYKTFLDFTPNCDYKPTNAIHADSPGVYTSEKNFKFNNKKNHLECKNIDWSVVNGI